MSVCERDREIHDKGVQSVIDRHRVCAGIAHDACACVGAVLGGGMYTAFKAMQDDEGGEDKVAF